MFFFPVDDFDDDTVADFKSSVDATLACLFYLKGERRLDSIEVL